MHLVLQEWRSCNSSFSIMNEYILYSIFRCICLLYYSKLFYLCLLLISRYSFVLSSLFYETKLLYRIEREMKNTDDSIIILQLELLLSLVVVDGIDDRWMNEWS